MLLYIMPKMVSFKLQNKSDSKSPTFIYQTSQKKWNDY